MSIGVFDRCKTLWTIHLCSLLPLVSGFLSAYPRTQVCSFPKSLILSWIALLLNICVTSQLETMYIPMAHSSLVLDSFQTACSSNLFTNNSPLQHLVASRMQDATGGTDVCRQSCGMVRVWRHGAMPGERRLTRCEVWIQVGEVKVTLQGAERGS